MKELGRKLLPENFSRILMTQIDAQFKNKRDRRYDPEFKKFALSLYFLSSRTYRELQKYILHCLLRSLIYLFTKRWNIL